MIVAELIRPKQPVPLPSLSLPVTLKNRHKTQECIGYNSARYVDIQIEVHLPIQHHQYRAV